MILKPLLPVQEALPTFLFVKNVFSGERLGHETGKCANTPQLPKFIDLLLLPCTTHYYSATRDQDFAIQLILFSRIWSEQGVGRKM